MACCGRCFAGVSVRVSTGWVCSVSVVGADGVRVEVRLTPGELERWRALAGAAGVSVSELVRARLTEALTGRTPCWFDGLDAALGDASGWREKFLCGLEWGRSVSAASRLAGVSRALVYRERAASREFAVSWELALQQAEQALASGLHASRAFL